MKLRRLLNPVLIVILVIVTLPSVLHAQASDPSPADGTVDVSPVNTTLSAAIEGTGDPVNVEFRGRVKQSFSIVALPDTQKYSASYPEIFEAQTQWVADNQTVRNIVFVTHEGDIVDTYTSGTQWANASAAISKLGGVPYGLAVGNHDFDYDTDQSDLFDQTFGHIYCTGPYPSGSKRNNYRTFTACGVPLLVLHLEFWPDSDDLEWAYDVLQSYPDRIAIITTHGFLDESGNREVHVMASTAYIWDALVLGKFGDVQMSPNDNVHFILCGHVHAEYTKSTWVDNADGQGGRYVHQLLADYQDNYDGWLRIMTFVPGEDTVYVQTYSPVLDQYQTDSDSEFTLSVPMAETPTDYELLGTHKGVAYGTRTSVVWPYDLDLGTAYEWYVTVSDGSTSENGPVWDFTTTATNVTVDLQSPVDQTVSQNPVPFTVEASCLLGTLVDASLYLGSPAQAEDAQITADNPDTNMGDNASINVDGASPHAHALIRFRGLFGDGPGQVPPGTTIDSAELRIYCTDAGNTMDLYRVTSDWSQASVTWNTAPSYDTGLSLPLDCSATGSRQATVTQFVQAWSDGQSNYGVLLTDTGTDGVDFHSTEGATPPGLVHHLYGLERPKRHRDVYGWIERSGMGRHASPRRHA